MLKKKRKDKTELDNDDSFISTDWNASLKKKTLITRIVKHEILPSLIASTRVNAPVRRTFFLVIQVFSLLAIKSTKSTISFAAITLV